MYTVIEEDLDTLIIRDTKDEIYQLVTYEYFATVAGYGGDKMSRYDNTASCIRCHEIDRRELWLFADVDANGHWQCMSCLLKEANSDDSAYSWYVLVR